MIPDYQKMMRPVLVFTKKGEVHIKEIISKVAVEFDLTEDERSELVPSGRKTRLADRVNWAKTYLKKAGLVAATKRGCVKITDRGLEALKTKVEINNKYLMQFEEFQDFRKRSRDKGSQVTIQQADADSGDTPSEVLRSTYESISQALIEELLDKLREASPAFFEHMIVELLVAMGYGGNRENAGRALGKSGDDGVDGVIDQDTLGVDQIYVQAKRYAAGNNVGPGAIRDFFGSLDLKKAQKGIFFTTSDFTTPAYKTAKNLGTRIVLINGEKLGRLMFEHNIGCKNEEILYIKRLDEDFFEWEG